MKKAVALCLGLLLAVAFLLPASASQSLFFEEHNITMTIPDDFTVIQPDQIAEHALQLQQYGTDVTQTQLKLSEGNYLFLAISSAMRCTLFLTATKDVVSQSIGDLITYPDKATAKALLLGQALPEQATVQELEQNGALFYRVDFGVTETIGRIAYFTVMNQTAYTLCVVDNNGSLSDNTNALIDTVFEKWDYSIQAEELRIRSFRDRITSVITWIGIPIALAAGYGVIRWMIRDIRRSKEAANRHKNIPKKPRR